MITTIISQLLLYAHALLFAFAVVDVIRTDVALLLSRRIDIDKLHKAGRSIAWLLGLLWLTGGALILLTVGFDLDAISKLPKLATKLTVVSLLTVNGLLLHWVAFPMLAHPQRYPRFTATVCAVLGGISSVTWLYASFVGVARLIAPEMSYCEFMVLYGANLSASLVIALLVVRSHIERLVTASFVDKPHSFV
ncbi:hypothetical protein ACUHMQ_18860 [Chitinimonas sp. PSY-7]|uniref:hypothetical protein n=1 Tax=Chitinimonas sp. PSY-7 TaxID=3459088 RepID=UPI0040400D38